MSDLEQGIRTLFHGLDEDSKIVKFENILADDNFIVLVRTKLVKTQDNWGKTCDQWVERFTNQTNSKWVVKATFPKVKRMEYRKLYVCKENSIGSRNHNKSCKGRIDIKVKKVTESTLKKDRLLQNGYNAEIKVAFTHSHDR